MLFIALLLTLLTKAQEPKLMIPVGHNYYVLQAQFSPDEKKIVTASYDRTAKIWNAATGQLLADLKGHTGYVSIAQFSPDGSKILTASEDTTARIWDALSGNLLIDLKGHTKEVIAAQFSPNGKRIITASKDNSLKIWDCDNGKLLSTIEGDTPATNGDLINNILIAAFSKDGKKAVIVHKYFECNPKLCIEKNVAFIYDIGGSRMLSVLQGHTDEINSVQFSPNGENIITGSRDNTAKIWDTDSGKLLIELKGHRNYVINAQFSSDGKKVITASGDKTAKIWDTNSGNLLVELIGHQYDLITAEFSPDASKVVTTSWDNNAKVWDTHTGELIVDLVGHTSKISSARFSPDGQKIVTGAHDNSAKIWNAKNGKILADLKGNTHWISIAKFSPDGKQLFTADLSNNTKIWDAFSGNLQTNIVGHTTVVKKAAFSPDGKRIFTTSENKISKIWDAVTGDYLIEVTGYRDHVLTVQFSPDGKKVIETSYDSTAKICDAVNGWLLVVLKAHKDSITYAQFSTDGNKVITCSKDKTAKVWNANTGEMLLDLKGHTSVVLKAHLNTDNNTILTAGADKYVKVWDAKNGNLITEFLLPIDKNTNIDFTPDGKRMILEYEDNTAKIWDLENQRLDKTIELGFNTRITDIHFSSNIILAVNNSEIKFFSLLSGDYMYSLYAIDSSDWAVMHSNGLFDASTGAMNKMYWVKGDEIIGFDQLKSRFWQPGLRKMIQEGKQLRSVEGMNQLKMYPLVDLEPLRNDSLSIKMIKRDGGYGRISVYVNNKEVIYDARPQKLDTSLAQQRLIIDLKPYLSRSTENEISVKVESEEGFVMSRGAVITEKNASKDPVAQPSFYAIVCGTSEYSNPDIKLKYAVPDARSIAMALEMGANNLFSKDSTHIYQLNSPGNNPSTKRNIESIFKEIELRAKPEDVVVVYLSGHGITYGSEKSDFYYLTSDASSNTPESFSDPIMRKNHTISTEEFTSWLIKSKARKQVMIIDACGSGKAVDNLLARREINPSQIKAIDRMKDRTGLYIISGCAADAVSYEASRYGQGLLTYSLLQAMKGAALKENKYLDVINWLNYAREHVPKLAEGIGGIQQPQLLFPTSGSFDLGILNESDKERIPLSSSKPVYVRSMLLDDLEKRDVEDLSVLINDKLNELSSQITSKAPIVYIDADKFPESCNISGTYSTKRGKLSFVGSVKCGGELKTIKLSEPTKNELVKKIIATALNADQPLD